MRLYAGTTQQFVQDNTRNQIAEKLRSSFFDAFRYNPSPAEVNAWRNSLKSMALLIMEAQLNDNGILVEYQLPLSSKRLDCMITGKDNENHDCAVIIELKQWDTCEPSDAENEVMTWVGGAKRDVLHPSVQASQYQLYLSDTQTCFYEGNDPVQLKACSYLHNYSATPNDVLYDAKFASIMQVVPLFTANDTEDFTSYLKTQLGKGEGYEILRKVENSKFRPSKKLMDHISTTIRTKSEYILLDEQLVVYDKILAVVNKGLDRSKKHAFIIKGGPGTGKSVIALNLMADLLRKGVNAHYATGSKAFTQTLRKIVGTYAPAQLKYFNSYASCEPNEIDVLICDESHRIRVTSNSRYTQASQRSSLLQIEEILKAAKVSVFFIDDHQIVRPNEIGSVEYIKTHASKHFIDVQEFELETQFRCNGSEAFINWVENTLQIRKTAQVLWPSDQQSFDFRIFNSPQEVEDAIRQKISEGYTGRMTAGYCWPWSDANRDGTLVNDVVIGDYKRPWNAKDEATHLARGIPKASLWAYDPKGMDQIGCIYTVQGFEFDYIGVIIGDDLIYDFETNSWKGNPEKSYDGVVKKSKEHFTELVKNTYRVLLSRGMKGCYIFVSDYNNRNYLMSRLER